MFSNSSHHVGQSFLNSKSSIKVTDRKTLGEQIEFSLVSYMQFLAAMSLCTILLLCRCCMPLSSCVPRLTRAGVNRRSLGPEEAEEEEDGWPCCSHRLRFPPEADG